MDSMSFYVTKTSGEQELFNIEKFRRSLVKAGAPGHLVDSIIQEIERKHPKSTKEIHALTTKMLAKTASPIAARYNLKQALLEFGPAGFPFEQFVAELFTQKGYTTSLNQFIPGKCITHEVDIVAQKDKEQIMIECKFHSKLGIKTNVKIPLYIKSRFDDINNNPEHKNRFKELWIVSNAQFTSEAIAYANCVGMKLLGWGYPKDKDIAKYIEQFELHPISALTILTKKQKHAFIKHGLVLCKDTPTHQHVLKELGFDEKKIKQIMQEAQAVCELK